MRDTFLPFSRPSITNDDVAAVENMTRAASLADDSYYLKLEAARLYSRTGDRDAALAYARAAIDLPPQATEARLFTARDAPPHPRWGAAGGDEVGVPTQET